VLAFYDPEH
jgi:hypothetical protein